MHIKKYAACVAMGVMSFFTANAQDIMPEALPTRPTAEKIVKEVAPVGAVQQVAAEVKEASVPYNANFGESVVQTALQYLGASYRSGMSGPYAFDCSALPAMFTASRMCQSCALRARSTHKAPPSPEFLTLRRAISCSLAVVAIPVR